VNFFSLEHINTFRKSGTVIPSSKYLIEKCLKQLSFKSTKIVVEFGMGNGCITQEILRRIDNDSVLFSFEINEKFCLQCSDKFSDHTALKIINKSAFEFSEVMRDYAIKEIDYVISSLPLSLFKENEIAILLKKIKTFLKANGSFVQYQYSLDKQKLIRNTFSEVELDFTWRNLPPAFIYNCK